MTESRTVRFRYSKHSDYRVVAANGVYGGPTPNGQIRIEFLVEHPTDPESTVHAVTSEGRVGPEVQREPSELNIAREFQVGVLITVDVAETMIRWLQEKVEFVHRARAEGEADATG